MSPEKLTLPMRATYVEVLVWGVAWTLAAVVIFYSLGPVPPGVNAFKDADKVYHAALYAATVVAFLFAAVWRPRRGEGRFPRAARWIVIGSVAAGVAIELLQGIFFGRDADVFDALADAAGAGLALLMWMGTRRLFVTTLR